MKKIEQQQIDELKNIINILRQIDKGRFFAEINLITAQVYELEGQDQKLTKTELKQRHEQYEYMISKYKYLTEDTRVELVKIKHAEDDLKERIGGLETALYNLGAKRKEIVSEDVKLLNDRITELKKLLEDLDK